MRLGFEVSGPPYDTSPRSFDWASSVKTQASRVENRAPRISEQCRRLRTDETTLSLQKPLQAAARCARLGWASRICVQSVARQVFHCDAWLQNYDAWSNKGFKRGVGQPEPKNVHGLLKNELFDNGFWLPNFLEKGGPAKMQK